MAVCARGVQQPDGTVYLVLDPLASNVSTCAFVVQSGSDINNSFLLMSAEDGGLFAAGLVSVWFSAYGVKAIINVIKGSSSGE